MIVGSIQNELAFRSTNFLETSDDRKRVQLQHQRKCAIRTKEFRKLNPLHSSSRYTERRRMPGRAWKRQQLTHVYRTLNVKAVIQGKKLRNGCIGCFSSTNKSITDMIAAAIYNNDANNLDALLIHVYAHHTQKKYWSEKCRWTETRHHDTLLTRVIQYGHSKCIQVVLNNIFGGMIYPTIVDHVCSTGRTALWYACRKGDLNLVRQLIEHGKAHIEKCGVLIVAAQNGHTNIVEYLLNIGCDPNRPAKNYNETALHAASRRNHLAIVNLLLKHGADPTTLDYKNRTALEYAIHKRHIDIAKALIYRQGGNFDKNHLGFTPLMVAANFNKTAIVDILLDVLPRQQALEELALLACKYTIDGYASRRDQAYCYFEMLLNVTMPFCNNAVCKVYDCSSECRTFDELAAIRSDDNAMRMHALLVSERISLKSGDINFHLRLIIKQSYFYRHHGRLHRCIQLRLHAYQLANHIKHKDWHDPHLPILSVIRLLIDAGADVDQAHPRTKSTPLHMIADCVNADIARSIIELLFAADAHIDCIDYRNCRPEDRARTLEVKELLRTTQKLSLKCRCAHLINSTNMSYANYLSSRLVVFVRMHGRLTHLE
ncbi:unnamed protein product [Rotaria sp. Silwood1]|nr:unnamed protein product [Rotaria sp. Silwood1]